MLMMDTAAIELRLLDVMLENLLIKLNITMNLEVLFVTRTYHLML